MLVFHSKPRLLLRMSDFLEKCVNSERQVKEASQLTLKQTIRIFVDCVGADNASCLIQRSKREAKFPIVSKPLYNIEK
ncbi:hypothetical protein BCT01_14935 [Vibrio tasmaniensis]|nr:hypothetical protein A162_13155 [Vibrio tasmaniensis 1F-155]PMO77242.1 hypothetical protein BCT01_14935 [Vibrio tasmaniensis]